VFKGDPGFSGAVDTAEFALLVCVVIGKDLAAGYLLANARDAEFAISCNGLVKPGRQVLRLPPRRCQRWTGSNPVGADSYALDVSD
jgi:hypothetical protein